MVKLITVLLRIKKEMSREIDRYVPQGPERKIQVIVATPSRCV